MSQTDAQAALAAAATVVASWGPADLGKGEASTLQMADAFMVWLRGYGRATVVPDERLVPNEDFRSPSHAQTERINPNDVTFAAAERERMASAALAAATDARVTQIMASDPGEGLYSLRQRMRYDGPHTLSPTRTTPIGARACECGEKWPCSQNDAYQRRLRGES